MEKITYLSFLEKFKKKWRQGQHVLLSGHTGSGKTYVAQDIRECRKNVIVVASKKKDETLEEYKGFVTKSKWPPEWNEHFILFWKKPKDISDLQGMREAIYEVMNAVFKLGGWCIYFDDLAFLSGTLKMDPQIRMMYTQVRSSHVTIVSSVQRPFRVPVEAVSQSKYILMFHTSDERDIERIAQESGQNKRRLTENVSKLSDYEFLFIEHGKEPVHVEKRN